MTTRYEWTVETVDSYGDINQCEFFARLEDCMFPVYGHYDIGLVRYVGDELDGEQSRSYAYIKNGQLPNRFDNGRTIPARFHEELKSWCYRDKLARGK